MVTLFCIRQIAKFSQVENNIPLSWKIPAPKQKEERQHQTVQPFQPVTIIIIKKKASTCNNNNNEEKSFNLQ